MVVTKSGKTFPESEYDWQFFCESVPQTLAEIAEKNFKVVIFTNQRGILVSNLSSEFFSFMNEVKYIWFNSLRFSEMILL